MSRRNYIEGFREIPIKALAHHYFINENCDIIKLNIAGGKDYNIIYNWSEKTVRKNIKIRNYKLNKDIEISPLILFMVTFYGYLPFDISTPFLLIK